MSSARVQRGAAVALVLAAAACGGKAKPEGAPAPSERKPTLEEQARTATSEDWKGTAPARAEELFAGRFAGVRVVSAPGGLQIQVRGASSVNGPAAPLYIVDGMPIDAPNGLVSINPHDIAKIEVLKDIGSTAYYGVRGANGVVLITTKGAAKPR